MASVTFALTTEQASNVMSQLPAELRGDPNISYDNNDHILTVPNETVAALVLAADKNTFHFDVPEAIRADQARLELSARGKLADVEAYIAGLSGDAKVTAETVWEYRTQYLRNDTVFLELLDGAGISGGSVDSFYVAAFRR